MMRFLFIAALIILVSVVPASAQLMLRDSSISVPLISGSYGFQFAGADMKDRFGNSSTIGVNFLQKSKSNWVYGFEYNYIFGSNVKQVEEILENLMTNQGQITDGNGVPSIWGAFERGFFSGFKLGRIFPIVGPNPNSGLIVMGGLGYMKHYINIQNENNTTPQINGDYKYGYDYLTSGVYSTQFIGYIHFGNSKVINFFGGIEILEAKTAGRRDYLFDIMGPDNSKRFEMLYTIRVGWFIPIYKRASQEYFYN